MKGILPVVLSILSTLPLAGVAPAQTDPIVRVEVEPRQVRVGESAELSVTVLVPTWFARPPEYPDFELANAITQLPPDSSYPTTERVGGETWSGIVRTYRFTPLAAGTYRMSDQRIGVAFAAPGRDPVETEVALPEIVIASSVPVGAQALDPFLAGRSLQLAVEIDGETDDLEAGDAVVVRYTAELDGMPAVFLPELAPEVDLAGASAYAGRPELSDGPPARRSEKVTLVFSEGGEYRLPGIELAYWNSAKNAVETATAAGVTIRVAGALAPLSAADRPADFVPAIAAVAVSLLLVGLATWRCVPRLRARCRQVMKRRRASEAYAFRGLQAALRSQPPDVAYRALVEWSGRLHPTMDARHFARRYGDESLVAGIESLSRGLYGSETPSTAPIDLRAALARARKSYQRESATVAVRSLPPLNP